MDEYVVMCFAQLIIEGKVADTIRMTVRDHPNSGSRELVKNAERLIAALDAVDFEPAGPVT
jgi:hypothetical protein